MATLDEWFRAADEYEKIRSLRDPYLDQLREMEIPTPPEPSLRATFSLRAGRDFGAPVVMANGVEDSVSWLVNPVSKDDWGAPLDGDWPPRDLIYETTQEKPAVPRKPFLRSERKIQTDTVGTVYQRLYGFANGWGLVAARPLIGNQKEDNFTWNVTLVCFLGADPDIKKSDQFYRNGVPAFMVVGDQSLLGTPDQRSGLSSARLEQVAERVEAQPAAGPVKASTLVESSGRQAGKTTALRALESQAALRSPRDLLIEIMSRRGGEVTSAESLVAIIQEELAGRPAEAGALLAYLREEGPGPRTPDRNRIMGPDGRVIERGPGGARILDPRPDPNADTNYGDEPGVVPDLVVGMDLAAPEEEVTAIFISNPIAFTQGPPPKTDTAKAPRRRKVEVDAGGETSHHRAGGRRRLQAIE